MDNNEFIKVTDSIRNKMKKWGDKIVVGQYTGENKKREEGERWTDHDGKEWEMKGGIARSISKLQDAKTPWWCPVCEKTMNNMDVKAFRAKGMCLDCVAKEETRMKLDGTWETESRKGIVRNQIAYLKDRLIELTYYHDYLETEFETRYYNHDTGDLLMVDKYTVPVEELQTRLREDSVAINKRLKELEAELEELESGEENDENTESDT